MAFIEMDFASGGSSGGNSFFEQELTITCENEVKGQNAILTLYDNSNAPCSNPTSITLNGSNVAKINSLGTFKFLNTSGDEYTLKDSLGSIMSGNKIIISDFSNMPTTVKVCAKTVIGTLYSKLLEDGYSAVYTSSNNAKLSYTNYTNRYTIKNDSNEVVALGINIGGTYPYTYGLVSSVQINPSSYTTGDGAGTLYLQKTITTTSGESLYIYANSNGGMASGYTPCVSVDGGTTQPFNTLASLSYFTNNMI